MLSVKLAIFDDNRLGLLRGEQRIDVTTALPHRDNGYAPNWWPRLCHDFAQIRPRIEARAWRSQASNYERRRSGHRRSSPLPLTTPPTWTSWRPEDVRSMDARVQRPSQIPRFADWSMRHCSAARSIIPAKEVTTSISRYEQRQRRREACIQTSAMVKVGLQHHWHTSGQVAWPGDTWPGSLAADARFHQTATLFEGMAWVYRADKQAPTQLCEAMRLQLPMTPETSLL